MSRRVGPKRDDPDIRRLERELSEALGSATRVDTRAGRLVIDYGGNLGVLHGVLERLGLGMTSIGSAASFPSPPARCARGKGRRALARSQHEVRDSVLLIQTGLRNSRRGLRAARNAQGGRPSRGVDFAWLAGVPRDPEPGHDAHAPVGVHGLVPPEPGPKVRGESAAASPAPLHAQIGGKPAGPEAPGGRRRIFG